jgi:integrase
MPKKAAGLSARRVETEKRPGMYADGGGLYLRIAPGGAKSWILRFQIAGRRRDMGLGPMRLFSLAEARERAKEAAKLVYDKRAPIAIRVARIAEEALAAAKEMTFAACGSAYIDAHRAGWRNEKHGAQWAATLTSYVYPVFGDHPVQSVDVGLVLKAIESIWSTKPETASRVRGRIESILDWATARGYRQGPNPATWRGHLDKLLPKKSKVRAVEHHAALPYVEIGAFMHKLRAIDGSIAARALEFVVLTAARTGEAIGARWQEIDIEGRLWVVPGKRMKSGRPHKVPLSDAAVAILEQMASIREGEFVFPGGRAGRPLSYMSLLMLLRRSDHGNLTTHGFRSTFKDWAAEKTSFPAEVSEMALAHIVSDKVEAAYRRGDLFQKRRELADAWARFCAGSGDNITILKSA